MLAAVWLIADPLLGLVWDDLESLTLPPGEARPGRVAALRARWSIPTIVTLAASLAALLAAGALVGRPVLVTVVAGLGLGGLVLLFAGRFRAARDLARAGLDAGLAWSLAYVALTPHSLRPPAALALDWRAMDFLRDSLAVAWPAAVAWLAPHAPAVVLAALFSLVYFDVYRLGSAVSSRFGLAAVSLLGAAGVLAVIGQALAAGTVAVLAFGQAAFGPGRIRAGNDWYLRRGRWYVMGCMCVAAAGVAWR